MSLPTGLPGIAVVRDCIHAQNVFEIKGDILSFAVKGHDSVMHFGVAHVDACFELHVINTACVGQVDTPFKFENLAKLPRRL